MAHTKGHGRQSSGKGNVGIGRTCRPFRHFSFPAADAHDPFVDFIPKGPVTTGALAQEQGFKSDVRCLMTLQDVHKGCVQLLEFRHGNRAHIDGKFHIRRNGIDRASP